LNYKAQRKWVGARYLRPRDYEATRFQQWHFANA